MSLEEQWEWMIEQTVCGKAALRSEGSPNRLAKLAEHIYISSISYLISNPDSLHKEGVNNVLLCCGLDSASDSYGKEPDRLAYHREALESVETVDELVVDPQMADPPTIEPPMAQLVFPEGIKVHRLEHAETAASFVAENEAFVVSACEKVRQAKEKVVFACVTGTNKSVALACVYLMSWRQSKLLSTLALLVERLGAVLGANRYRVELFQWAQAHRFLEEPDQWPQKEDEPESQLSMINSGWDANRLILFQDDADYDDDLDFQALSPQDRALIAFRRQGGVPGLQTQLGGPQTQRVSLLDESACASDGELH